MSDGREERQQQEQRRRDDEQQHRKDSRDPHRDSYQDRLDRFPADPFHPERPDS